MNTLFDPGLQPERTALAWRRTGLALLAGSLVAARILPESLGAWAVTIGLAGVAGSAALLYAIHRRYRRHHERLTNAGDRSPIAGGRLIAAMALFVFCAAGVAVMLALAIAVRLPEL